MVAAAWRETFEGVSDGANITTSNTTLDTVSSSGGKIALPAAAVRGARGGRFSGSSVSGWCGKNITASGTASVEAYFKQRSADVPTGSSMTWMQIRDSSGGRLSAVWMTTGQLYVLNAAGANLTSNQGKLNSDAALSDGNYRLQITAVKGTTTSNGRVLIRLDNLTTGTSINNVDTGATQNTGTADYTELRWGKTGAGGTGTIDLDELAYLLGSTAAIDLSAANQSPTCQAGPDQTVEPWTTVLLDFSGSTDPEGNALTYAVTQTGGTTVTLAGSGATRTFTAPGTVSGDVLTFDVVANDGTSDSVPDTLNVTVLAATEFACISGALVPLQISAV